VKPSRDQPRSDESGARLPAEADRKIDFFLDDVDVVIGQHKLNRQSRIQAAKLRQQGGQYALAERRICSDP
jgi:hypothetical protein